MENQIKEEIGVEEIAIETVTQGTQETVVEEEKPSFFKNLISFAKKNWKKIAVIGGAVIVTVGVIFGVVSIANAVKANKIEEQLKGMVFEEAREWDSIDSWSVSNITIGEDGTYKYDNYDYSGYGTNEEVDKLTHSDSTSELKVTVSLSGKAILGRKDIGYEIVFEDDEIVGLKSVLSVDDSMYKAVEQSSAKQKIRETAVDIFGELTKWKNSNFTKMVTTIYKDYDIYCDAVEGSDSKYLVTIKGDYYPNKSQIKNYTQKGTFAVEVDLNTKEGKIVKDEGVTSAYDVYLALNTSWYY